MSLHPSAERAFREAVDQVNDPELLEKLNRLFITVTSDPKKPKTVKPKKYFKNFIENSTD